MNFTKFDGLVWRSIVTKYATVASATPVIVPGISYPYANTSGYRIELRASIKGTGGPATGVFAFGGMSCVFSVDGGGSVTATSVIQDPFNGGNALLSLFGVDITTSGGAFVPQLTPLAAGTCEVDVEMIVRAK